MSEVFFLIPVEAFDLRDRQVDFDLRFTDSGASDVPRVPANPFTFLDIAPFIQSLANGDHDSRFDLNNDGRVTFLDISPFITALSQSSSASSGPQAGGAVGGAAIPADGKQADLTGVRDLLSLVQAYNSIFFQQEPDPRRAVGAVAVIWAESRGLTDADISEVVNDPSFWNLSQIEDLFFAIYGTREGVAEAFALTDPPADLPELGPITVAETGVFVTGDTPTFTEWQNSLRFTGNNFSLAIDAWCLTQAPRGLCLFSDLLSQYNFEANVRDEQEFHIDEVFPDGDREVSESEWVNAMSVAERVSNQYLNVWGISKGIKSTLELVDEFNSRVVRAEQITNADLATVFSDMSLSEWQAFVRRVSEPEPTLEMLINTVWRQVPPKQSNLSPVIDP